MTRKYKRQCQRARAFLDQLIEADRRAEERRRQIAARDKAERQFFSSLYSSL